MTKKRKKLYNGPDVVFFYHQLVHDTVQSILVRRRNTAKDHFLRGIRQGDPVRARYGKQDRDDYTYKLQVLASHEPGAADAIGFLYNLVMIRIRYVRAGDMPADEICRNLHL